MPRRLLVAAVLAAFLLVPVGAAAQDVRAVRHVVVLSFDGLRADALRAVMPAGLLERAAFTWQAKTTLPSVTLPSHTSMFTGVPPSVHQMLANDWRPSQGYVKLSTAFSVVTEQGGTAIGDFQLVQAMLADQQAGVMAGRAMVREVAARYVSGEDRRLGPSAAKLFCTEMVGKVADLAVQIHGGNGYMRGVPVERIYREVRLLRLYEGTSEIQRLILGGGLVAQAKKQNQR